VLDPRAAFVLKLAHVAFSDLNVPQIYFRIDGRTDEDVGFYRVPRDHGFVHVLGHGRDNCTSTGIGFAANGLLTWREVRVVNVVEKDCGPLTHR